MTSLQGSLCTTISSPRPSSASWSNKYTSEYDVEWRVAEGAEVAHVAQDGAQFESVALGHRLVLAELGVSCRIR
ncbi:hypothetical protein ABZT04_10610 [Streptomyces sp. NPDC005492]|uniref:hypothetical protein n=1 Tax=Streptomyces sp. NPDC005492 TaxID=3156883 RepID=UPI0033A9DBC4